MASHRKHRLRFIRERRLLSLIGVEYALTAETQTFTKGKLYLASCVIILIALLSLVSMYYAFDRLFDSVLAGIVLSLFFALLFFNLYIFLVQTFSKASFGEKAHRSGLQFSHVTRILFVLFIGFIVSCPLCCIVFKAPLSADIDQYKEVLKQKAVRQNETLYAGEINRLTKEWNKYSEQQKQGFANAAFQQQQAGIALQNEKQLFAEQNAYATERIDESVFFLQEIRLVLTRHFLCWGLILFVLFLFSLPVFLVQSISANNEYFSKRRDEEKKRILNQYQSFKKEYADIFQKQGMTVSFHEAFADAPFNTMKWKEPDCSSQDDFLREAFQYPEPV